MTVYNGSDPIGDKLADIHSLQKWRRIGWFEWRVEESKQAPGWRDAVVRNALDCQIVWRHPYVSADQAEDAAASKCHALNDRVAK